MPAILTAVERAHSSVRMLDAHRFFPAALAALLMLPGPGCGQDGGKPSEASASASASAAPGSTAPFTSAAGRYSVQFPLGPPQEGTKQDQKNVTWKEAKSAVGAYYVQYADFPSAALAQAAVTEFVQTMKSEIQENKEVTVDTQKARELRIKISDTAMMWMRLLTVDKRAYKIGVGTKNDAEKAYKFLDSFKLSKE
jgi:hypothetical protein